MEHICKNCGTGFDGKFCNNCGQKFDPPRFTFKHIMEEAFHAFTHADKSFISFGFQLLISPGRVAYEYIVERRRKKYFNPFTFFLLIIALSLFVEGARLRLEDKLFHQNNVYGQAFNVYGKFFLLAVIPIVASGLWLVNGKRSRLLYSEYTVFAMMLISVYSLLELFMNLFNYCYVFLAHRPKEAQGTIVYLCCLVAYMIYACYDLHKRSGRVSALRQFLSGLLVPAFIILMQVFIIWAVFNRFEGIGTFRTFGITFSTAPRGD